MTEHEELLREWRDAYYALMEAKRRYQVADSDQEQDEQWEHLMDAEQRLLNVFNSTCFRLRDDVA